MLHLSGWASVSAPRARDGDAAFREMSLTWRNLWTTQLGSKKCQSWVPRTTPCGVKTSRSALKRGVRLSNKERR